MTSSASQAYPYGYGYQQQYYPQYQYDQSAVPAEGASLLSGMGLFSIALCMSCFASIAYGVYSYLTSGWCDGDSITGHINSNWWFWIIAFIPIPPMFPIILTVKMMTALFC